jgi:hypothetical protein
MGRLKVNLEKLKEWKLRSALKAQQKRIVKNVARALAQPSQIYLGAIKHGLIKPKVRPTPIKKRRDSRAREESVYSKRASEFVVLHPICPVTGERTSQVHHSAKRSGGWLLLERYWIAVSHRGHEWIENNKAEAEKYDLMIRIRLTYKDHVAKLIADGESLSEPIFYKTWNKNPIKPNLVNEK